MHFRRAAACIEQRKTRPGCTAACVPRRSAPLRLWVPAPCHASAADLPPLPPSPRKTLTPSSTYAPPPSARLMDAVMLVASLGATRASAGARWSARLGGSTGGAQAGCQLELCRASPEPAPQPHLDATAFSVMAKHERMVPRSRGTSQRRCCSAVPYLEGRGPRAHPRGTRRVAAGVSASCIPVHGHRCLEGAGSCRPWQHCCVTCWRPAPAPLTAPAPPCCPCRARCS